MYQTHKSNSELNQQLIVGLKKHLLIAQDTRSKKADRVQSLTNIAEVLEYVIDHINEAVDVDERAILRRFFVLLLVKVKTALVQIHSKPENFTEEIGFLNILIKL